MKAHLEEFARVNKFRGKGPLSVALVITSQVKFRDFPLNPQDFLAESGTQVAGLGYAAVKGILAAKKITKVLAKEGGRTSRGSVQNMILYVNFLNEMYRDGLLDMSEAESFWIEKVNAFFAAKPFILALDPNLALGAVVRSLMDQASQRQKAESGVQYVGALMQYLVGAKLDVVLGGRHTLDHHNANQNDERATRTGDFDIGDTSIHVTTAPSEALIAKCVENLAVGRRPVIITGRKGAVLAEGLAENRNIANRLDIIEFEQFMATNIYELSDFDGRRHREKVKEILKRYNEIVAAVEPDPSLAIELAAGK